MRVHIYDTTLRDGAQGENVSFSVEDKLLIVRKLDDLGIDYIEGGWPGSNPRDKDFFKRARDLKLKHARLAAFGSTRYAKNKVEEDPNVIALIESETPVVTIFGKSWKLHTERALGVSEEQNLAMIAETVRHIKQQGREVIYDAEHFFDGYIASSDFALRTIEAAQKAGADVLVLCDTNGGTIPARLSEIFSDVRSRFDGVIGILGDDYPGYFPVGDTGALTKLLHRAEVDRRFYESLCSATRRAASQVDPRVEARCWKQLLTELLQNAKSTPVGL